jgi:hypothetical protein
MTVLENLAAGLTQAAGADEATRAIRKNQADRRATQHEELEANTKQIFEDLQGLKKRKSQLNPQSPTYKTDAAAIDADMAKLQQTFHDLYHPANNPGALNHLGGFIKKHLPGPWRQPTSAPATPAQAKESLQQRMTELASAASTPNAPVNTILMKRQALKDAGFSDDQIKHIEAIDVGLEAKPRALPPKTVTSIEPDPESPTGYSKVVTDAGTGEEIARQTNVLPPRGFIASTSTTKDPFGVTSTTTRHPILPGQPNGATNKTPVRTPAEAKTKAKSVAPSGSRQLDAQGHIPASSHINSQLREAANNLLDGMDVDKLPIPQRDRAAAEALAKEYGWVGQGLFGPKDKLLIRESTGILKQLSESPSLAVLDDTASRMKIQQVLQNPDKRGFIGQTIQGLAAQGLDSQEQQFVTLYNQAVGRISGLSQLVRSGRATEAQIERLKQELPNPATTSDSAHARQKLAQIQNEIDIALQKGQFSDTGDSGVIYARDPQGKLHQAPAGTALPKGWTLENAPTSQNQ